MNIFECQACNFYSRHLTKAEKEIESLKTQLAEKEVGILCLRSLYNECHASKEELETKNKELIAMLERFIPDPKTIQWERREIEARDLLAKHSPNNLPHSTENTPVNVPDNE